MRSILELARKLWQPMPAPFAPLDGWVVCGGDSMTPTVRFGERVRVRPCARIAAGDVVVFKSRGTDVFMLHRVVLVVPLVPWFVHLGDAPSALPGLAATAQVVGCADLPRRPPSLAVWWRGVRRVAEGGVQLASRLRRGG